MAGLSVYARNKLLDLAFGGTSYTRPATVYLESYTSLPGETGSGGTTPSGNGYAGRTAVTSSSFFAAASSGEKTNALAAVLGTCSGGTWGTLAGIGIWDASTSGNLLALIEFDTPLVTVSGKRVKLRAGSLTVTCTGAWSDAFANALLDHVFGGPDYTPPATWYGGLVSTGTTELSGNGYARVGLTNNATNFPNASAGAKAIAGVFAFGPASGNWSEATRLGLFSASSGGAAAMLQDLTAPRTLATNDTATADASAIGISAEFTAPDVSLEPPLNIVLITDSRGSFVGEAIATLRPGDTVHGTTDVTVVGNATAQLFIDDYATRIAPLLEGDGSDVALILLGLIEGNDGLGPAFDTPMSAAAAYALQEELVDLLIADGVNVVVCTAPDCGEYDGGAGGNHPTATPGNRETVRFELDALLRASFAGGIACVDLAVVPDLANAYDTEFFSDTIHLTSSGQVAFATAADAKFDELTS